MMISDDIDEAFMRTGPRAGQEGKEEERVGGVGHSHRHSVLGIKNEEDTRVISGG
jgi:hypothetical protein